MDSEGGGWVGRVLAGRYAVTRRIGSGGMSTVYEATDEQLGRKVAVKLFNAGEARDDSRRRSEVDVLARLNHPHLVTMYDAHLASGDETVPSFLVMELVNGPDLRSTLDHGPLRGAVAAQVATDIAEGLAAMHAQGIVHRDLKPANILLAPTGLPSPTHRAKLADFGIAHLVGADRMTTVGTIIGTASYLSPEQAAGAEPGPEADVYALGLVILEGLTGRREYPGTVVEAMSARASRDPVIGGGIPASWVSLLSWMTARDPLARPTALDVAIRSHDIVADLATWEASAEPTVDDATAPLARPTMVLPAAAAAAAGAAGAAAPGAPAAAGAAAQADASSGTAETAATAAFPAAPAAVIPERRSRRIAVVAVAAAAALAGAVWLGGSLMASTPTADPAQPVPASTQTGDPSTDPATDPANVAPVSTEAPENGTGDTPESALPSVPATPVAPPTPAAPATPVTTPTPPEAPDTSATPAPGDGNNGNGNGNGNGGKGKG
ncbi:hypothetical protein B7R54_00875 [Subtercola boreus]|uniref:non-specific serine/threonine protein kinase n=1 Tax=Subtercola boreus TaxID=120213 RepID=A0A3E0VEE3_9MICO|nr:serine/threonine-protein kinase [Subtercola boreus]RFA07923.1 hypothetical protein B7R54_00875 [Subtercola boreus]TQL55215.1 serine/threonine protein kinase [Subtercola boreus]